MHPRRPNLRRAGVSFAVVLTHIHTITSLSTHKQKHTHTHPHTHPHTHVLCLSISGHDTRLPRQAVDVVRVVEHVTVVKSTPIRVYCLHADKGGKTSSVIILGDMIKLRRREEMKKGYTCEGFENFAPAFVLQTLTKEFCEDFRKLVILDVFLEPISSQILH